MSAGEGGGPKDGEGRKGQKAETRTPCHAATAAASTSDDDDSSGLSGTLFDPVVLLLVVGVIAVASG